jgi:hypothetical protein
MKLRDREMKALRTGIQRHLACLYCGLLLLSASMVGAETPQSNLIERSPFLPPDYGKEKENLSNANLQNQVPSQVDFVGYSGFDGNWEVALYFTQSKEVHWMKPGDLIESVRLVDFDPQRGAIQISERNVSKFIRLNAERPPAQDAPPPVRPTQARNSILPPGLNPQATDNATTANNNAAETRRVIPRRRVILPKN